jgi:hypothetical protein
MTKKKPTDEQAFAALVETYGKAALAQAAGLKSRQAATRWTKIPHKHAINIATSLGIPRSKVLPSLFS